MKALISLFCIFLLAGCSGSSLNPINPPSVQAAAVPYVNGCANNPLFGDKFGEAVEHPGSQIDLVDTACSLLAAQGITATGTQTLHNCGRDQVVELPTTTADFRVIAIKLWIGADANAFFESGVCLEIFGSDGTYHNFVSEWDKHIEGYRPDTPFQVDLFIPAGSRIRLSRDPHGTIKCTDIGANNEPMGCLTQESATLYGH